MSKRVFFLFFSFLVHTQMTECIWFGKNVYGVVYDVDVHNNLYQVEGSGSILLVRFSPCCILIG